MNYFLFIIYFFSHKFRISKFYFCGVICKFRKVDFQFPERYSFFAIWWLETYIIFDWEKQFCWVCGLINKVIPNVLEIRFIPKKSLLVKDGVHRTVLGASRLLPSANLRPLAPTWLFLQCFFSKKLFTAFFSFSHFTGRSLVKAQHWSAASLTFNFYHLNKYYCIRNVSFN